MKSEIIKELEARIAADCTPVNCEAAFNEMLDETYSFGAVGGPFAHMTPSRVLLEMDPTAHRCGVNDFADGMDWSEVGTETYKDEDIDKVKEELIDEVQSELDDAQEEIDDPAFTEEYKKTIETKIAKLEAQLDELNKHSF